MPNRVLYALKIDVIIDLSNISEKRVDEMNSKYEAVLFDFDGTIADTGEGIFNSVQYAVNSLGFEPLSEDVLRTFIGPPIYDSFKRELDITDEQAHFAVEKYREIYAVKGIYEFRLYDGILELFGELKENGVRIAVASAKPERFVRKLLAHIGIEDYFSFVSAPADDKADQSKVGLINKAVEGMNVDKSTVLMVGDRHFDVNGANGAGVDSVGVTFGYGSRKELENAGATFIATCVDDIRNIIFF